MIFLTNRLLIVECGCSSPIFIARSSNLGREKGCSSRSTISLYWRMVSICSMGMPGLTTVFAGTGSDISTWFRLLKYLSLFSQKFKILCSWAMNNDKSVNPVKTIVTPTKDIAHPLCAEIFSNPYKVILLEMLKIYYFMPRDKVPLRRLLN
jgi:hypothetical protein